MAGEGKMNVEFMAFGTLASKNPIALNCSLIVSICLQIQKINRKKYVVKYYGTGET